jgi:hypothetical protein
MAGGGIKDFAIAQPGKDILRKTRNKKTEIQVETMRDLYWRWQSRSLAYPLILGSNQDLL